MTPRPGSPARGIMRTLRTGLSQPPGSDLSPLLPLARQALAFIDRGDANDPATAGEASELAYLLAALLETGDENFRLKAFGLLFRLGVEGEVLAVVHLEKLPEDQALVVLANLTDEEKLLFANAFFRRPRHDRPRTAAFGLAVLAEVVEKSPDELLMLLDLLANRHEYPALPLRNVLVRGRLGVWLRRLLQMDLSAEQTRYMARVAGRLRDPSLTEKLAARLGELDEISAEAVCRALAETPGLEPALVGPPIVALIGASTDIPLLSLALAALARCDEPRAAVAAAGLIADQPDRVQALAQVVAGFSLAGFGACLRALPPPLRKATLGAVYAFFATALPEQLRTAAEAVRATGAHAPELCGVLAADLASRSRIASRPFPRPPGPRTLAPPKEEEQGLWNRVKTLVASPLPTADAPAEALRQEMARGGTLRDRQILWKSLEAATMAGGGLHRCNLKASSLARAALTDATVTDCQFSDVYFEQARLTRVSFVRCRFANCRFSRADWDTVRFADCELRLCAFEAVTARDLRFSGVDALECDFFMAGISGLTLDRVRFRAVSLVRAVTRDLTVRGALFSDCLFEMAVLPGTSWQGARTEGCYFAGSRFSGPTDEPDILGAMAKDEALALAETADGPPVPAPLVEGKGLPLLAAVVDALLFSRDIRRRRLTMLANNKRRLAWARHRLGEPGAAFLDMIPGLIQAGLVRDDAPSRPAPAARVRGYAPNLATAKNLAAHFGQPPETVLAVPEDALAVEAVYTIGSTGTVAQTGDSDLDVWVCLDAPSAARPDLEAFRAKLDAVSRRADRELGLEVHFFVMTAKDIKGNVFGYSEDEGYGSAQGCLLKEEFYRTALTLAGAKPAWWCIPARITPEAHARALAGLARAEPETAADSLDFGCVDTIAGTEFFGASLWMIVKSLTSPFKSIIKFGLLDKYASEAGAPVLLCELLKEHIVTNQGGLWRCDPYALLFSEVSRHYRQRENPGTLELLRQAFLQKTGFDPCEEYLTRSGEAVLDHFFPYAPPSGTNCPPPPRREPPEADGGFSRIVALSDAITTYLLRAYERLRQQQLKPGTEGGLSARDQAMLARRIGASFGQRVGKIRRLPFLRPGRELFTALEIGVEDPRLKELVFVTTGESLAADRKTRRRDIVRQDGSPVRLAAWLVANEIYRPGQFLQAGALPAPLTLPDMAGLLDATYAAFPTKATFAPPLSWGLDPERVTAALVVVNLLAPREEKRLRSVDVLYATTWGELFHAERSADLEALSVSPSYFLANGLGLTLSPDLRLEVYAPVRSQCQAAWKARRAKKG